jgi:hypothetical protein
VSVKVGGSGVKVWVGSKDGVLVPVGIDVGVKVKVPLGVGRGVGLGDGVTVTVGCSGAGLSGTEVNVLVATLGTQIREPATIKSPYKQLACLNRQTDTR